jgi:UDP-N-acetylmuramate dehydrogenase
MTAFTASVINAKNNISCLGFTGKVCDEAGSFIHKKSIGQKCPYFNMFIDCPDMPSALFTSEPSLKGSLVAKANLSSLSWFRTGGEADWLFMPFDEDDLAHFLQHIRADIPLFVLGLGSNLLVRDGGIEGVVIRLGKGFGSFALENEYRIRAGAGAADVKIARAAAEAGIDGMAFMRGIPGAVGGLLRMNGGAYGGETADVLVEARALDRQGHLHVLTAQDMQFSYRHCGAHEDLIFTQALFQGRKGDKDAIQAQMNAITEARSSTQPVNTRTGGSTFKNPQGFKAWELIDKAGCRGLRRGGAQVSDLHCNFLINHGNANAADLEELGEDVRRRVFDHCGIMLEWEIKRVGRATK